MGMSSSQARLLTLTARMHDIEYKAQRIEAQKLQLANDSRHAYEDYLVALDAKKVQFRSISSDGSVTFIDATLASLENGAVPSYTGLTSNKTFLIKNANTNEVYVTREFANEYGITAGEAPSAGELDDYLETHGAHKREITRTETNYSDIQSVNPVDNKVITAPTTQTVADPDSYSISGTLSTPVDTSIAGTTSYSVSGTTPSVSSVAGVPTALTKTVVTSGTDATGSATNVSVGATSSELTKFEYVIPKQNFKVNPTVIYTIDTADLSLTMQQLSDKYNWNWDFTDTVSTGGHDLNNLNTRTKSAGTTVNSLYGLNLTDTVNDNFKYTSSMTLNQLLTHVGSLTGITYNASAGTISGTNLEFDSDDDNNGTWGTSELEHYLMKNKSYTGGTTKTFTSATLMADFVSSDQFNGTRYGDFRVFKPDGSRIECTFKYYPTYDYSGSTSNPPANFTYADYLNYIANEPEMKANNFTWWEDAEGIHTTIENGYTIGQLTYSTMPGQLNNETTNTTDTTITINRNAIAEDIYLARSIIATGGVTPEEYNTNHNSQITSILSEMSSAYGNYSTDENKRQLVLFNEALTNALTSGNQTEITNALALLGTTISSDKYVAVNSSTSTPTTSGNITSSNTIITKNNVTYVFNDSNVSITPSTTEIPDGTSDNPGTLTVNGSDNELEKYLAYQCYQNNNSKTYEQYLTGIQGHYNTYQLAELVENVSSYVSQLAAGNDVSSSLTKYNSSSYTLSQTACGYNVSNTSTSTSYSVSAANTDDILDRLAYDIYTYQGSTGNPNTIKSSLNGIFNSKELTSLSSYYGTSTWNNIISTLSSSMNKSVVDTYLHNYDSYTVNNSSSNDVSIVTVPNSHTVDIKGSMNIPTIQGIASNLVVAFRKAGYTVEESDVVSKLNSLYGTDNDANNEKLANINHEAYQYLAGSGSSSIANIYANLFNGSALSVPSTYTAAKYTISRANLGTCSATYGTTEVPTGKFEWIHDSLYDELVEQWNVLKQFEGNIFVIVDEPLASSYEFVRNLLCETGAFLLEFNKEVSNMKETNVAVETAVREISDEKELKKAEAKYEATMRLIDRKDRRYDTELAAVESERNATKQEMETLKTVIHDNGERTFKLFS